MNRPPRLRHATIAWLLLAAGAGPAPAANPPVPLDAVVAVRAVRGFQGLFEQPREASAPDPDAALGGPFVSSGIVVEAGERLVLTALRGVDAASSITLRAFERGPGTIPRVRELRAELVAADPTMNLALLRAEGLPAGVALATAVPPPGSEVLRLAVTGGRVDARRVTIAAEGLTGAGDPLRLAALPALFLDQPIERDASGGALLDPATMTLVALVADAGRTGIQGERRRTAGPQYAIPSPQLASFLAAARDDAAPAHGALPWPGPELAPVDGRLAALLGRDGPGGFLVLEDWSVDGSVVLREGDVLIEAGGRPLGAGGFPLAQLAHDAPPSRPLAVRGWRGGQPWDGAIPLIAARPERAGTVRAIEWAGAWFQDPADAFFARGDERRGALVAFVAEGSAAEAAGLQALDLVQEVFGAGQFLPVTDADDLERAVNAVRAAPGFTGAVGLRVTDPTSPNLFAGIRVVSLGAADGR